MADGDNEKKSEYWSRNMSHHSYECSLISTLPKSDTKKIPRNRVNKESKSLKRDVVPQYMQNHQGLTK